MLRTLPERRAPPAAAAPAPPRCRSLAHRRAARRRRRASRRAAQARASTARSAAPGSGTVKRRAGHARRLRQAHVGATTTTRSGDGEEHHAEARAGRRQGPRHRLDHRGLHAAASLGKAGRRHLRRRRPGRRRAPIEIDTPEARLDGARSASPTAAARRRTSTAGRRSPAAPSTPSASASASTPATALPLLPGLDHRRSPPGAERVEDLRDHAVRARGSSADA